MDFKVINIFESIDGEVNGSHQGALTTFIRLSGCNLRCLYCDTTYSFSGGNSMTLEEIMNTVRKMKPQKVTITGGEPLLYRDIDKLIVALVGSGYAVSIETNGSFPKVEVQVPLWVRDKISWVFDYKLPSSGMEERMDVQNFSDLSAVTDWVKFVISDDTDFMRALQVRDELENRGCKARFAYSPIPGFSVDYLLQLLLTYGQGDEVISVQIHKLIWPNCGATEEH